MLISSQDLQNVYEKFYARMRNYLWPYKTLQELAQVEVGIYTRFIDLEKLEADLNRLRISLRDVIDDDDKLRKSFDDLMDIVVSENDGQYSRLPSVQEVDPEKNKNIRTLPIEEEEEERLS